MKLLKTYRVMLKHDNGRKTLIVSSFKDKEEIALQLMEQEKCPRYAIKKIKVLRIRTV